MWTSDRSKKRAVEESIADIGAVTLDGNPAGVYLEGERRWTAVYSPGGYCWRPAQKDQVLVLKAGAERESPCIIGKKQEAELQPGEISISSAQGLSSIHLYSNGTLHVHGSVLNLSGDTLNLSGNIFVNGKSLTDFIDERIVQYFSGS